MSHDWFCSACGDRYCDGCDPADWLPEGETLDPRDNTPPPPAVLDPHSCLNMARMIVDAAQHGDRPWPYKRAP